MKKYLFIPVEIYVRELPAKIFLAIKAAKVGYSVVLGRHYKVEDIARNECHGTYLATTLVKGKIESYGKIKENGNILIGQDEEGLVYYNQNNFLQHRVIPEIIDKLDLFFTWGEHHKELIEKKVKTDKVQTLGNIRIDLLKSRYYTLYEKNVEYIKNRFGKFILINTNLAAYNHVISRESNLDNVKKMSNINEADEKFYIDKARHQGIIMNEMKKLAQKLEEILPSDCNIVIRPHPAEKISGWEDIASERIRIIREGNVIPWIYAAECIVQQNCTTAVEATIIGKPVLSFIPDYDERFDGSFINDIAPRYTDKEDLVKKIEQILHTGTIAKMRDENVLEYYVSNIADGKDTMDEMLKRIESVSKENHDNFNEFLFGIKRRIKDLYEDLQCIGIDTSYRDAKYIKIKKKDINSHVRMLEKIEKGEYSVKVKALSRDIFIIESK